jgi:cytosine deaminase
MVFPAFVDMHTHLDKGHIWPRSPNPDGTFMGALTTVRADSAARWSAEDLRPRMSFSLRSAYAHGTRAIRTHLDSIPPQDDITWPVFRELQEDWADRIALQAVCLIGCDHWTDDDGPFGHTADLVAETKGGVLGMVTYPVPDLRDRVKGFFAQAASRGLDADFHVDETMDASVETLRDIAELKIETGFEGRVVVGHCCSLSVQEEARALDTLDLVAKAGIDVVSLPMCNLYLQDRAEPGTQRTPGVVASRWCMRCVRGASASASPPTTRAIRSTPMATWTCWRSCGRPRASVISTIRALTGPMPS